MAAAANLDEAMVEEEEEDDKCLKMMKEMQGDDTTGQSLPDHIIAPKQPLRAELTMYLTSKDGLNKVKPHEQLRWWQEREQKYPLLCQVVRKIFSVQETSRLVERLFSTGGLTIQPKRTNLKPEHVHKLVLIRENMKKLNKQF